jgi:glutamate synthase (NADPH/NADH) small chain
MNGLTEHFPLLSAREAIVEANRCLYCYDAPCTQACPTQIDIPRFIKKISTGNLVGSAAAILEANLLGATCARVCPVQVLCEGSCVLGAEHKPIAIGRLQRYAMVHAKPVETAASTGRKIAVVGSGPAGLSCAGELARRGHSVTVFEKRALPGGLSTYGIITLREPVEASLEETKMIERMGVRFETGRELGGNLTLDELRQQFEAVFLGVGLGSTPMMGIPGEELILDGLAYIEESKLRPESMRIGRQVVVIGAGNTAIDCATVAKRLGAERVTILYRRTEREMSAYPHEVDFIRREGVEFRFNAQPNAVTPDRVECAGFTIPADQVVKAIGQIKPSQHGYIEVDENLETSTPGVFAGGDCIRAKGAASTVMAVQDGKLAAAAIHRRLIDG